MLQSMGMESLSKGALSMMARFGAGETEMAATIDRLVFGENNQGG